MMMEYLANHLLQVKHAPQFQAIGNRAAWEAVDPAERDDLLALAEEWRDRPYPVLTAGMYASYIRTGSRKDCETPYFARRVKLCAALLHMCLTGEDTDLPIVEDGLWLICEETTWAISAHLGLTAAHPFPDARQTVIDLFAAQTGMILSFAVQLLEERLHPDLQERVRMEMERRILRPFMENDNEWWMGFVRKDLCNWTPWIVSNVLMAANVWAYGGKALVERACGMLDRWLVCVPEDGGCDEGAGYWNMAAGAFLDCLMLLEKTADVRLWDNGKLRRMMAYPELMHLGSGWFANFADCDARPYLSGERLQYAGEKTDNLALVRMGVQMRGLPRRELSDTPHLSRVLMRLFHPAVEAEAVAAPAKDVWLPDLQVRLVEKDGLMLAAKGGHNGESHNHNDVGSFVVAVDGDMQIVDAGNMVYTAKTFSKDRYELWNCRSVFHNVPIIGEIEQRNGTEYAAADVASLPDGLELSMAGAYPTEAGVHILWRELHNEGDAVMLTDRVVLKQAKCVTWTFMLRHEPTMMDDGVYAGRIVLEWNVDRPLRVSAERIEVTDARMQANYPGYLWRLTVSTAQPLLHHEMNFRIEKR